MLEELTWEQRRLRLAPGDVLIFYTDGVTDAENESRDFYGLERLLKAVRKNMRLPAEALQEALLNDLYAFTQKASQMDDIALMILSREQG